MIISDLIPGNTYIIGKKDYGDVVSEACDVTDLLSRNCSFIMHKFITICEAENTLASLGVNVSALKTHILLIDETVDTTHIDLYNYHNDLNALQNAIKDANVILIIVRD